MKNYTFEQKLNAIETIVSKALCVAITVIVHLICLMALASYNLGKKVGEWYYAETESLRAVKAIAEHMSSVETNVEEEIVSDTNDLWEQMETEFDELESKVHTFAKIRDLESQFANNVPALTGDYYDAPTKGRCRKGYRRVGNVCMLK